MTEPTRRRYTPLRDKSVKVMCSLPELAAWQAAADKDGRTLSDWLRRAANQAATGSPHPPR